MDEITRKRNFTMISYLLCYLNISNLESGKLMMVIIIIIKCRCFLHGWCATSIHPLLVMFVWTWREDGLNTYFEIMVITFFNNVGLFFFFSPSTSDKWCLDIVALMSRKVKYLAWISKETWLKVHLDVTIIGLSIFV